MDRPNSAKGAENTAPSAHRRRWEAVCGCILLVVAGLLIFRTIRASFQYPDSGDMDFGSYYRAAEAVRAGETPYQIPKDVGPLGVYPYAPAYPFLLMPLSYLDYISAFRCWLALNWAATLACFVLAAKLVCPQEGSAQRPWSMFLATAAAVASYFWYNNSVGQAGVLVLLGCLAWAFCQRRGWPMAGGMFLALACATKLAPFILAPYMLLRRDRRGLAGLAVGLLAVFLVPALWVGVDGAADLHMQWARHTMASHIPMQTFRRGNQSLLAQLARLPAISNGHICYSLENLEQLHRWYPVLLVMLAAGLYVMLWRSHRILNGPALPETRRQLTNLHLAQLLVFMVVAHPRAWRCNYVALLFPCMTLATWIWQRRRGSWLGVTALASIVAAVCWPTDGLGADGGWSIAVWLQEGKHLWGALLIGAACWNADRITRIEAAVPIARRAKDEVGIPMTLPFESAGKSRRRAAA